jgi:hypothetical protein
METPMMLISRNAIAVLKARQARNVLGSARPPRARARQARRDLGDVPQTRRSLGEIANEPPPRRRLSLRGATLEVEMHELQRVLERQVRELAGGVLGHPEGSALDCSAEADVRVGLGGHERMFS